jgi:hypothetical protein
LQPGQFRPSSERRQAVHLQEPQIVGTQQADTFDVGKESAGFRAVALLQRQPIVAEQERKGRGNLAPGLGLRRTDRH